MRRFLLLCVLSLSAHASQVIDLSGSGWSFKTTLDTDHRPVTVPHSWLLEKETQRYIGHGLYERDFDLPSLPAGKIARLHFDAVYDVAEVWVNGKRLGRHEGGYTPFEFDITKLARVGRNHVVVDVDNTPTLTSIPSLSTGHLTTDPWPEFDTAKATIVGWLPYGGIVRPVHVTIGDAIYVENVKIDAIPNLQTGDAAVTVRARIRNASANTAAAHLDGTVAGLKTSFRPARINSGDSKVLTWTATLPKAHLWSVREPYLYDAELHLGEEVFRSRIGVRKIEVRGTELLLNGRVVHLNGANRIGEDEEEGSRESDAIIERDLTDMLAANMRMMRIAHYPQTEAMLRFADEHGMLIIAEAGNWGMSSWQIADPDIRKRWKLQMNEMMEMDWNHPSVIAWSVGNEYESYKQEGKDWTRDMRSYTLSLDQTRLVTFADRYTGDPSVKTGADDASQFSDFVSVNVYGNYAKAFDHVHQLYPDKPVFITEFGKMTDAGLHDPERIANINEAMTAVKARPWIIGASLWTWNDYRSFIKGTPSNGIRSWGVVTLKRERRDSWKAVQELFKGDLP
ncbi:MAG: beta-galactosidase [Acidobacteriaceae bacterium]|nr:beta-galactosidase [Acidobacteriaceae bacterium]